MKGKKEKKGRKRKSRKNPKYKRGARQTRRGGIWPFSTKKNSKEGDHLEEEYLQRKQHEKVMKEFKRLHGKKLDSLPEDVMLKIYSQLFNHQVRNIGRASRTMRDHAKTEIKVRKDWVKQLLKEPDAFTKLGIEKEKKKAEQKSKSKTRKSHSKSKSRSK